MILFSRITAGGNENSLKAAGTRKAGGKSPAKEEIYMIESEDEYNEEIKEIEKRLLILRKKIKQHK